MENEWVTMFRRMRQPVAPLTARLQRLGPAFESACGYEDCQSIAIYLAVLRRIIGTAGTGKSNARKPFLFILSMPDGNPSGPASPSIPPADWSETVRDGVVRGSTHLPMQIVWVEDCYGVGVDPDGEYIPSGGAVLRFTEIRREGCDIAHVRGSIHRADFEPQEFEYILEKKNGCWDVRSSYHLWDKIRQPALGEWEAQPVA
jgi:hypothetical protein